LRIVNAQVPLGTILGISNFAGVYCRLKRIIAVVFFARFQGTQNRPDASFPYGPAPVCTGMFNIPAAVLRREEGILAEGGTLLKSAASFLDAGFNVLREGG
jgi:hypothetical protein